MQANGKKFAVRLFYVLIDNNGNTVVEYKYDAWGNHKVVDANGNEITSLTHIGNLNPFRYRGYYYDVETGFYFLKSRYYDPEVGRFLNMDAIQYADTESVNGMNLYAYCGDNPVKNIDPTGQGFWDSLWKVVASVAIVAVTAAVAIATAGTAVGVIAAGAAIGGAVGGIAGGATGAIDAAKNGEDVFEGFANGMLSGTVTGTISGAVAASPIGRAGQTIINSAISGVEYCVNAAINNNFNSVDFGISLLSGGLAGYAGGKGLLNMGKEGLKAAGNILAKQVRIKELSKFSIKVGLDYLFPNAIGSTINMAGSLIKSMF